MKIQLMAAGADIIKMGIVAHLLTLSYSYNIGVSTLHTLSEDNLADTRTKIQHLSSQTLKIIS